MIPPDWKSGYPDLPDAGASGHHVGMTKHLSFWLGMFCAALVAVPIAAGIMGAAEQELRRIAVMVFLFVAGLVLALVLALIFRDWILRKLFGRAEATLDDVSASLIAGVSAATAGDRAEATAHAQALVQRGMGWYSWTNFYRWVIATAIGLLLAFGAFMGTVLLFEQNRKLGEQTEVLRVQTERLAEQTGFMQAQTELMEAQTERLREQTEAAAMQNEIMSLNLVNEIRGQLLASVEKRTLGAWLSERGVVGINEPLVQFVSQTERCQLFLDLDYQLSGAPSQAAIEALIQLGQSAALGERVVNALKLLARDSHGSVVLGAVMALERIGAPFDGRVILRDMFLADVVDLGADTPDLTYHVTVQRSYAIALYCPDCLTEINASVFRFSVPIRSVGRDSLLFNSSESDIVSGVHVLPSLSFDPSWASRPPVPLEHGPFFPAEWSAWLTLYKDDVACEVLSDIDRGNPLLTLRSPT